MYDKKERISLFRTLSLPIMVVDAECKILDANLAVAEWTNRSPARIIGGHCYHVATGHTKPCWETEDVNCPVKLALDKTKPVQLVHEKKFGGRAIVEEVVATPVYNGSKEIEYIVLELRDISELLNSKEAITYLKNEISNLRKIIPICASCKKIRDDDGFWQHVENYLSTRTDIRFSHSLCPQCMKINHPQICDINPAFCQDEEE